MTSLEAVDPSLLSLREHWREQSLAVGWLRSGDWFHPAVDAVVEAVTSDDGVLDALEALGVARASHGVGMGETIDDLACLYRVLEGGAPPLDAVRALCEGWASPAGSPLVPGTCMDPESGLPTLEYLSVRLIEEFTTVGRRGGKPAQDLCFVLVDVAKDGIAPWNRLARSAAVGRAIEAAFGPGHPAASIGGGVFAVLHHSGPAVADAIARLSRQIDVQGELLGVTHALRHPPRIWIEAMADDHREAVAQLAMRRPSRTASHVPLTDLPFGLSTPRPPGPQPLEPPSQRPSPED